MTPVPAVASRWKRVSAALAPYYGAAQKPGVAFLLLAALCLAKGVTGLGPLRAYTHDSFFLLDGAWRIWCGQRPFHDFFTDAGLLTYLPITAAFHFAHGVAAVNWAIAMVGMMLAAAAVWLVFPRLRAPFAALFCAAVVLFAIAPFPAGESVTLGSQAGFYNRWGYAVLAILLVECVFPARNATRRRNLLEGTLVGAMAAAAFFAKFTYGGFALLLIGCTARFRPQSRARWLGLAAGFAAVTISCLAFLRFDIPAIAGCMRLLAQARTVTILTVIGKPLKNPFNMVAFAAVTGGATLLFLQAGRGNLARRWIWIFAIALGLDIATLATNTDREGAEFYLTSMAVIPLLAAVMDGVPATDRLHLPRLLVVLFGLSVALVAPGLDIAGLAWAAVRPTIQPSRFPTIRINGAVPESIVATEFSDSAVGISPLIVILNDGLELARRESGPREKVAAFWATNPFAYWLRRPPIHGGALIYGIGGTFSEKAHLSGEYAFGDADVILFPKVEEDGAPLPVGYPLRKVYGPYLESHFHVVAETSFWKLYRRRPPAYK